MFYRFPHILILDFWILNIWKTSDCLFMFPLRVRKEQIISYEWLFKSEQVYVNFGKSLCSRIFRSSTLKLWRGAYLFWWTIKLFSEMETFFCKYWNLIMVPVVFWWFLVLFSRKNRAFIPLSNDKHNSACYHRENYFDRTYVNI